jgi:hypothetical protein
LTTNNKNPFNPGPGVIPPFLSGRETEIKDFSTMLDSIENGGIENRIMYGLRGVGKTVLMNEFNKICLQKSFLPIKRPQFSEKYCDPDEFVKAFKYDLRTGIETFSTLKKITGKIKSAVTFLKPKSVGVPELFYYEPSYEHSQSVPLEDHLLKYLVENWKIIEQSQYKGVIFLFDEFHTIKDTKRKKWFTLTDFIGVINEAQKQGCRYFVVLTGLPPMIINIKKSRSYSERMFKTIEIDNLSETASKEAITKPLKKINKKFSKELITKLILDTGKYPYFIQFYCKEILNNISKKSINLKDYERIQHLIVNQLEYDFFDPRMELLSDDEKKVLFSMSKIKKSDIEFEEIKKISKIDMSPLSSYLKRLENKGLIYNYKRGIYRFSLPMLKEYLKRNS